MLHHRVRPIGAVLLLLLLALGSGLPAQAQEGICDSAPEARLAIGDWAVVTEIVSSTGAGGLRLRDAPFTSGTEVDLLPAGTLVRIIDGPACNDGFQWFYIASQDMGTEGSGVEGWSAEAIPGSYYLAPTSAPVQPAATAPTFATNTPIGVADDPASAATPAPATTAGTAAEGICPDDPTPSYLAVGAEARAADQARPVRIRATPEADSIITELVYQDQPITIVEGPTCAEGLTWWQVDVAGRAGWTVEAAGGRYLLIDPANTPPEIAPQDTLSPIPPSPTPVPADVVIEPTARPQAAPSVIKRVAYTADGALLAVGDGTGVRLYETTNYTPQTTLNSGPVLDFVWLNDGLYAVTWALDSLTLVSVPDGGLQTVITGAPYDPAWAAAAPDGQWLILGPTSDGTPATLWDLTTAAPPAVTPYWWPGWGVVQATFSPDDASVLINETVYLRRCETAGPGCLFDIMRNDFRPAGLFGALNWSGDGETLIGFSDRFWLWDGNDSGIGLTVQTTLNPVDPRRVALNSDASRAAIAAQNLLEIWDMTTYVASRVNTLPGPVSSLAFHPTAGQLAAAAGNAVNLYDAANGEPLRQVE